jgi:hypothetical protein
MFTTGKPDQKNMCKQHYDIEISRNKSNKAAKQKNITSQHIINTNTHSTVPKSVWLVHTERDESFHYLEAPILENMKKIPELGYLFFDALEEQGIVFNNDSQLWDALDSDLMIRGWSDHEFTFLPADNMHPGVMKWFKNRELRD